MPNSLKAGLWTALFTFITLFGTTLVGWLNDLIAWAAPGDEVPFPDPSALKGAAFSAIASAAAGLVNWLIRWAQDRTGVGPETPVYTPPGT